MEQPPWGVAGIFNEAREKKVRNFILLSAQQKPNDEAGGAKMVTIKGGRHQPGKID